MSDDDAPKYFDPEKRRLQKALSRQRDEERLARGKITMMELQKENMAFRRLRRDRIMFARCPKTGKPSYLAMEDKSKSEDDESR